MNILQIVPELNVGGVERGTVELACFLTKQRHKAVVISNGGRLVDSLQAGGGRHYKLPVHEKSIRTILLTIPKVCRIIKKEKIDIVHARSRVPAIIGFFAAKIIRVKFVTTCHGYYRRHFISRVMGWGKKVIVISNAVGRHMIDNFHVPTERICLIHRGVDLKKFRPQEKKSPKFTIGIIARLTPIKGHIYFIRALPGLVKEIANLRVLIVGGGSDKKRSYRKKIWDLVKELNVAEYVEFQDTQDDIENIISALDVLVLPTITPEAFGRVLIEAGACGVCVIATKVGGVVDIVADGKTGLLVPPADHDAITRAVLRLYRDHNLCRKLRENARDNIRKNFSLNKMLTQTIQVYEEVIKVQRILVIKMSALGDVILSIPSIRALRHKYPDAHISVLVDVRFKDVFQHCPYIDEVMIWKQKNDLFEIFKFSQHLRQQYFDIVIDLQNSKRSHLLSFLSLANDRYGYDRKFGFLLNHRIKNNFKNIPPVNHQLRLLSLLGIKDDDHQLKLWPAVRDREKIEKLFAGEWLTDRQLLIGMSIFSSPRWQSKRWPADFAARVCDLLAGKYHARVVIAGTREELPLAQEIARAADTKPIIACGKTKILEFAALVERCRVFICCDSAAMHVAAAMNVNFVALFGPTSPLRHAPPAKNCIILEKTLSCRPCYKPKCRSRRCMKEITPQEVITAIDRFLAP
ncbi:MAG: lipopolysaccharide heptosyltransferase II [Candidatus Omnitrophota bacterium]